MEESKKFKFTYKDENDKERISISAVTDFIMSGNIFKTIFESKSEKVYWFEDGIYKLKGKEKIKTDTELLLNKHCTSNIVNEVLEKIKRNTAWDINDIDNEEERFIPLINGIYDLETECLLAHGGLHCFTHQIPIVYDKNKKPTNILKFFKDTLYPEDIPVIQEWLGFCLYRKYFIKKAMILFGEKNTGKTVFLNILTTFLNRINCAGISLQKIASSDKFALSSLKGKYVNIYDDLSSKDLSDSGGFKIATGGGYISAEYKFGDPFQFMTFAKNIFATNKIPNVKDIDDDAYYERWMPIQFDNQVEKEKQDNFLTQKLTTQDEMSGLFNWALEGLNRLLKNGRFSFNKDSKEIKQIMERQNNPLVAFVEEVLIQEDGNRISKETMFLSYTKWCQEKKIPRLSKEQLGRNLAKYTNYLISKGGKERVWENVKINEKYGL